MSYFSISNCVKKASLSRFRLTILAAMQAHRLYNSNVPIHIKMKGDKPTVMALKEIDLGIINLDDIENNIISSKTSLVDQKYYDLDELESSESQQNIELEKDIEFIENPSDFYSDEGVENILETTED